MQPQRNLNDFLYHSEKVLFPLANHTFQTKLLIIIETNISYPAIILAHNHNEINSNKYWAVNKYFTTMEVYIAC